MWQQAYLIAYVATGVGACRLTMLLPRPVLRMGGAARPFVWLGPLVAAMAVAQCREHWGTMDQVSHSVSVRVRVRVRVRVKVRDRVV